MVSLIIAPQSFRLFHTPMSTGLGVLKHVDLRMVTQSFFVAILSLRVPKRNPRRLVLIAS